MGTRTAGQDSKAFNMPYLTFDGTQSAITATDIERERAKQRLLGSTSW